MADLMQGVGTARHFRDADSVGSRCARVRMSVGFSGGRYVTHTIKHPSYRLWSMLLLLLLLSAGVAHGDSASRVVVDPPDLDSARVERFLSKVASTVTGGSLDLHWSQSGAAFWIDSLGVIWRWTGRLSDSPTILNPTTSELRETSSKHGDSLSAQAVGIAENLRGWSLKGIVEVNGGWSINNYERPCATLPNVAAWLVLGNERERLYLNAGDGTEGARCELPEDSLPRVVRDSFPISGWVHRERPSPDGRWFGSLDGDNFLVRSREHDGRERFRVDGSPTGRWYFASDIWEAAGDSWSPNSRYLVARQHDTGALEGIKYLEYLDEREHVREFRYWARVGEPLPIDRFTVFDVQTGELKAVELPQASTESFVFFTAWSPTSKQFAVIRYSRDLRLQQLIFVNPATGRGRVILEERSSNGWVKWPSGPRGIEYLEDGTGFLWRSNRSGYFHWYRYDIEGSAFEPITRGEFDSGGVIGIDSGWVYFHAHSDDEHPYDMHINRVRLNGEEQTQLTQLRGLHTGSLSRYSQTLIDVHQHLDRPPTTSALSPDTGQEVTLAQATVDEDFRQGWSEPLEFELGLAEDRKPIHGLIFRPPNFDPNKKYPVIERIYGAMQIPVMRRGYPGAGTGWAGGEYYRLIPYLNSLGFVVVTVDTTGTPGRGREFNLATHGTWPEGVAEAHAEVLRKLATQHTWIDLERLGIAGNSWGGYMALHSALTSPDLFKAVSASVPEIDLIDHVHWIEWQLGLIERNRDHYERYSILPRIQALQSPLLLVAGTSDVNVPVSNTMKVLDALAEAGKDYELVLFPGTSHAHQGRGDRRYAYAVSRMARFFARHLGQAMP
ncbi:MAG: prolyl oligopeptidase family serine peptidase [Pseudomonadota bacterium]